MARPSAALEWPAGWSDPSLLALLEGTPFRRLLLPGAAPPALASAAAQAGVGLIEKPRWRKAAEVDWRAPGDPLWIGDAVWPAVGAADSTGAAEAGPTGLPWLDANGWLIRMARDLAPAARIWIRSDPPEDAARADAGLFVLAQWEARVHGARRVLWIPPPIASALAGRRPDALAWWRRLCSAEAWWDEHEAWDSWQTLSPLLVLSDFAGPNQYPAFEFLNLAARRNLFWRAAHPARLDESLLRGAAAVVYIDQLPLEGPLLALLQRFAESGGLLACLGEARGGLARLSPAGQPHPRFEILRCGRGRVALSRAGWEDPYIMAQDIHLLMSRRRDVVRLFNPGSILAWPVASPDRRRLCVHLVNYSRYGAAHDVVLQTWRPVEAAWIERPGQARRQAEVRREAGGWEVVLDPFDIGCSVELEGHWDAG